MKKKGDFEITADTLRPENMLERWEGWIDQDVLDAIREGAKSSRAVERRINKALRRAFKPESVKAGDAQPHVTSADLRRVADEFQKPHGHVDGLIADVLRAAADEIDRLNRDTANLSSQFGGP